MSTLGTIFNELIDSINTSQDVLDANLESIEKRNKARRRVAERIDRIRLFRKLLVNVRMNIELIQDNKESTLRIHQLRAVRDLIEFLENEGYGDWTGHFVQPCGSGKTVLYGTIARLMDVQTLVLVPRSNLIDQTKSDWVTVAGVDAKEIGIVNQNSNEIDAQFVITNYQMHLSRMRNDPKYRSKMKKCELVICDEAHRALGNATGESIDQLDEYNEESILTKQEERSENTVFRDIQKYTNKNALKLGFTATPSLLRKSVGDRFGYAISRLSYADLVRAGILVKFKVMQIPAVIVPGEVQTNITARQERKILDREEVYLKGLRALQQLRGKVREKLLPVAFCSSIRDCDKLNEVAKLLGMKSAIVTSREYLRHPQKDHLRDAEQKLLNGEIDFISSVDKLQIGWNFPVLNTILQFRATLSAAILTQQAGRVSRMASGKNVAYVIEPRWKRNRSTTSSEADTTIIFEDVIGKKESKSRQLLLDDLEEGEEDADPFYWEIKKDQGEPSQNDEKEKENAHGSSEFVSKKLRFHKIPLTLAEAFHVTGETNLDAICEGWDNTKLEFTKIPTLEENGTVKIENQICVGLNLYASFNGVSISVLKKAIEIAGLQPVAVALTGSNYVPVYRLVEIENLQEIQDQIQLAHLSKEGGDVIIEGFLCIGLSAYASFHGLSYDVLKKSVENAGLQPMNFALSSRGEVGGKKVEVYKKSDVETLPYVQKKRLPELDQSTAQVAIQGKTCTSLSAFSRLYSLDVTMLGKAAKEEGVKCIGRAIYHTKVVDVYEVSALNKLAYVHDRFNLPRLSMDGEITLKGERHVSLSSFCSKNGLSFAHFQRNITNVKPKGFALTSRGRKIKIYRESDITPYADAFLRIQKLPRVDAITAEVQIDGEICVGLNALCLLHPSLSMGSLERNLKKEGIYPIGKAQSFGFEIDVYNKESVFAVPYVKERLKVAHGGRRQT